MLDCSRVDGRGTDGGTSSSDAPLSEPSSLAEASAPATTAGLQANASTAVTETAGRDDGPHDMPASLQLSFRRAHTSILEVTRPSAQKGVPLESSAQRQAPQRAGEDRCDAPTRVAAAVRQPQAGGRAMATARTPGPARGASSRMEAPRRTVTPKPTARPQRLDSGGRSAISIGASGARTTGGLPSKRARSRTGTLPPPPLAPHRPPPTLLLHDARERAAADRPRRLATQERVSAAQATPGQPRTGGRLAAATHVGGRDNGWEEEGWKAGALVAPALFGDQAGAAGGARRGRTQRGRCSCTDGHGGRRAADSRRVVGR